MSLNMQSGVLATETLNLKPGSACAIKNSSSRAICLCRRGSTYTYIYNNGEWSEVDESFFILFFYYRR